MSSKKKRKSPCSFASSKKPSKSKAFAFIRYIVRAGRQLKAKAKTNLQTRTQKSHGRTIVAGNRLQENLVKSVSCWFCHADVTLLEDVSVSSGLSSSWIVSCENKHCPSRNSSENLLTNLVAGERRNSDLAKDIFRQEQHLSPLCNIFDMSSIVKVT